MLILVMLMYNVNMTILNMVVHQILSHEKKKKYLAELNSRCRGLYQVIRQSVQVAKAEH